MRRLALRIARWAGRVALALAGGLLRVAGRGLVRAPGRTVAALRWLASR